jgi:hypothetical protein
MKKYQETNSAAKDNLAFIDAQNLYLGTTQAAQPWILER